MRQMHGQGAFLMFSIRSAGGQTIDNPTCTILGQGIELSASDERNVFHEGERLAKSTEDFLFPVEFRTEAR